MKKAHWIIAGQTDPGCVRENNEDNLAIDTELGLMVVADGMGGHNAGEVASRIAVETMLDCGRKRMGGPTSLVPSEGDASKSVRARQLEHCIQMANTVIFEKAHSSPQDYGMGTTIVAAVTADDAITVGHVGDSRVYVLRNEQLQVLTQDHSLVMEQLRRGLISAEQAEHSAMQNVLIRALGTEAQVKADVEDHPAFPGDMFLLCTDGLTKMLRDEDIARVMIEMPEPAASSRRLIELAKDAGGIDNITVIVARMISNGKGMKGLLNRLLKGK